MFLPTMLNGTLRTRAFAALILLAAAAGAAPGQVLTFDVASFTPPAGWQQEKAAEEIQPITDIRSTAWYRQEVTKVLVRDALNQAWTRAGRVQK